MPRLTALLRRAPVAVLAAMLLLAARPAPSGQGPAARPNLILCMADDQGWGDVGYNGNPVPRTPVLDEMARTGLRFDRFYAAAPVCSPTRGSVMTGRHPNRFGCFNWGYTLRPQEVTVAEALRKAGYATGHFGKWHLGSVRAESPVSPGASGFDEWVSSPNFYENDALMSQNGKVVERRGESSRIAVDAALEFIGRAKERGQPFLAVVWFGSPHNPHHAAAENAALYPDLPAPLQQYYGEVTGIDRAMGHLRGRLRELGIAGNTLLWYTSDNGPQGPERQPGSAGGLRGRKASLWEGGIRVPTVLEWPARVPAPRVTAVPCGSVDLFPTLLAAAGARVDRPVLPLDGVDLLPLIEGKPFRREKPLGFWVYPAPGRAVRSADLLKEQAAGKPSSYDDTKAGEIVPVFDSPSGHTPRGGSRGRGAEYPGHAAWTDGDYKLHRIAGAGGAVTYRLFDLARDREEKENLAAREPERAQRMQRELEAWQRSVVRSLNGEDYAPAK